MSVNQINTIGFEISKITDFENSELEFKHRESYFEIVWLKDGQGVHHIDLHDHPYKGSVMYVLAPGQIHHLEQEKKSDGYIIRFSPTVFEHENSFFNTILDSCIFNTITSCPGILIPKDMQYSMDRLFMNLIHEFNRHDSNSKDVYSSYLKLIVVNINRAKKKLPTELQYKHDLHYALFRQFKIALEKFYKKEHGVQFYANELKVESRLLNAVSKKYIQKSAGKVIRERILLEAQRRLYHESKSIKEICFELGFDDPAYFTRFFKKNQGVSPQQFKNDLHKIA